MHVWYNLFSVHFRRILCIWSLAKFLWVRYGTSPYRTYPYQQVLLQKAHGTAPVTYTHRLDWKKLVGNVYSRWRLTGRPHVSSESKGRRYDKKSSIEARRTQIPACIDWEDRGTRRNGTLETKAPGVAVQRAAYLTLRVLHAREECG